MPEVRTEILENTRTRYGDKEKYKFKKLKGSYFKETILALIKLTCLKKQNNFTYFYVKTIQS
jgi:hypothetical protein